MDTSHQDKMKQYEDEYRNYLDREKHLAWMIRQRVEQYGDSKIAVRHKPNGEWIGYTWKEFGDMIDHTAMALLEMGVTEKEMVGIFAPNRVEWSVADIGAMSIRAASVPIYATNSREETEFIVNHADMEILFAGDQNQYDIAMDILESGATQLRKIIAIDKTISLRAGEASLPFTDMLEMGKNSGREEELAARREAADPDDLATLIYTSGTTGDPKGVMLTHQNFLAMVFGANYYQKAEESDVNLAFLPLSHVFERAWTYGVLKSGAEHHYCHDTTAILDFLAESKPMFMTSVPRMWEKVHATMMDGLEKASPVKRGLFSWAMKVGGTYQSHLRDGKKPGPFLSLKHRIADTLVLSKIRDVFGGRVKMFNVGGSAFSAEIAEFFFNAGILLLQGYGMTECFVISMSTPYQNRFGACGRAVPLMKVRISDEGEIQATGPSQMLGYYKRPDLTAEMLTKDGWIRTGDVGHIDEDGFIFITDRIKDLMKTSGGKYIAPQRIETMLKEDFYIEQVAVVGDKRKYVAALIVPSFEALENWAADHGVTYDTRDELLTHEAVIQFFENKIDEKTKELGRVEKIKRFTLLPEEFTQERREITPTQKIRRKVIEERYKDQIEKMYQE